MSRCISFWSWPDTVVVTFEFLYDRPGFLYSHMFFVVNIKAGWGREKKDDGAIQIFYCEPNIQAHTASTKMKLTINSIQLKR